MASEWKRYRRTAVAEMRPYQRGDSLDGVSISGTDYLLLSASEMDGDAPGGFIARNPANHADKWYVAQEYAEANFDLDNPMPEEGEDA